VASSGERVFRSLLNQSIGQQIAISGGIGLAASVKREMIAMQEKAAMNPQIEELVQ